MLKEKIKNFITKKTQGDNKKNIENLVMFLILLIITVIAINVIWGKDDKAKDENNNYKVLAEYSDNDSNNLHESEYNLEEKLEDILSKMQGVGKAKVLITYSQTSSIVPIYSESESRATTEETDSSGGTRKQETASVNKEVVTDTNKGPITQTVIFPKIEGAIVIAEGGQNVDTKANIIQAVAAVTGIATYKVQVFGMEK